jgi:hypothetical protein
MSSKQAISMGSEAARKSGVADDVIKAAAQAADDIAKKRLNGIWGQLKAPDSKRNFFYGATASAANWAATFWAVGRPIYECIEGILKVYQLHDEGEPELQDPGKMQWAVQWYIDRAVRQISVALISGAVLNKALSSWAPGIAYNIPVLGKLFKLIDPIYNKLPPAAQVGFKVWISSEAGQEAVAKWIAGELLMPGTDWKIPGGPSFRGMVADPVSGVIKSGYDLILRGIGSDKAQQLPPKDNKPKQQAPDRYDLGTGRALNPAY